jgi:hypothetical protein
MFHHLLQQSKPIGKGQPGDFGNHGQRDSGTSGREYKINLPPQCWDIQGTVCKERVLQHR